MERMPAGPGASLGPGLARSWPCGPLRGAAHGGKAEENVTVAGFETRSLRLPVFRPALQRLPSARRGVWTEMESARQ